MLKSPKQRIIREARRLLRYYENGTDGEKVERSFTRMMEATRDLRELKKQEVKNLKHRFDC